MTELLNQEQDMTVFERWQLSLETLDLYIIFFIVGLILFAVIALYSYLLQQKTEQKNKRAKEIELFSDNEPLNSKNDVSSTQEDTNPGSDISPLQNLHKTEALRSRALNRAKSALSSIKKGAGVNKNESTLNGEIKEPSDLKNSAAKPGLKPDQDLYQTVNDVSAASEHSDELSVANSDHARGTDTQSSQLTDSEDPKKIAIDANSVITDLVAKVLNPNPIEQHDLLSLFREHDFKFHRQVHIYGLNELTDMWRDIEFELPTARFLELGISIQLCDRDGAMTDKELHDFQQMVLQFCDRYDAPFEFSMEADAAMDQAKALDQVGRRYDSMAVLNVVPKSKTGFRMADIQSCARDLMMSADKNGIFLKTEGQKNNITVLYRLACTDGAGHFGLQTASQALATPIHDLVVYMNVPSTREPEIVFQQMVKDANDLATWLDGKVVDRTGKAITQRAYSALMQQISDIAYSMQQEGLVPGDAVSKKLF